MNRRELLGAAGTLGGAALAGCLGLDRPDVAAPTETDTAEPTDSDETTAATETETTDGPTVTVSSHPEYGDILADSEGMTLYLFTEDEGGESACYDACAESWPPLTAAGEPTAGEGVTAELGTTERTDGSAQVTAAGNPLYYFAPDENPGDATGQGVNDVWFVLAPDGAAIRGEAETATTEESDGEGSGSGNGGGGYY